MSSFRLADIFGDGMILQRDSECKIFGTAPQGAVVTVKIGEKSNSVTSEGRFCATLPPFSAGGAYEIEAECRGEKLIVRDVCFGEVWLAGGQSNMEMLYDPVFFGQAQPDSLIRQYNCPRAAFAQYNAFPWQNESGWMVCNEQTAPRFSSVALFFAREIRAALDVPVGIIYCNWGGSSVSSWTSAATLAADSKFECYFDAAEQDVRSPFRPGALYDNLLKPVMPYFIKGAIFYQGESDIPFAGLYARLLSTMMNDWRCGFGADFPLIFVQIAGYCYDDSRANEAARLRESQEQAESLIPLTYMVSAADIGEEFDIHPRDKKTVGIRLADTALAEIYGVCCRKEYPRLSGYHKINSSRIELSFVGEPVLSSAKTGFEVFCGGESVPFELQNGGEKTLIFTAETEISEIRYAFCNYSVMPISNNAGLPLLSFRISIK